MEIVFVAFAVLMTRDPVLGNERGLSFARDLLWSNRYGSLDRTERAAFIVEEANGDLRCVAWPATYEHASATFKGTMPAGTIAIIHTHPINAPWPSEHDRVEARRLGIAIYAMTPESITKAPPSHDAPELVVKAPWLDPPPAGRVCH